MYDWANSAYITNFAANVAAFFTGVIVDDDGWNGLSGQTLWSLVISIGAIVLFLIMPVLGAVADYAAAKKRFLRFFATAGALITIALPLVPDGSVRRVCFRSLAPPSGHDLALYSVTRYDQHSLDRNHPWLTRSSTTSGRVRRGAGASIRKAPSRCCPSAGYAL